MKKDRRYAVGKAPSQMFLAKGPIGQMPKWRAPFSAFRRRWELTLFVITLALMFIMPFTLLFADRLLNSTAFSIAIYLTDLFYLANFRYRMFYFCFVADGRLVFRHEEIAARYLQSWRFVFDLLGVLPFKALYDIVALVLSCPTNALAEAPKVFRWVNFFYSFEFMRKYLSDKYGAHNAAVLTMVKVFLIMLVSLNIFGCLLLKIGCPSIPCVETESWVLWYQFQDLPMLQQLLRSNYIVAQTIFTVGYGDFTPVSIIEMQFMNGVMLLGVFLYALLIAVMTSVIANQDATEMTFVANLEKVSKFLNLHQIPAKQKDMIEQYFDYLNTRQGGMSENQLMDMIPAGPGRNAVKILQPTVRKFVLFRPGVITSDAMALVLERIESRTYPPYATVIRSDSVQAEFFILQNGRISVVAGRTGEERHTINIINSNQSDDYWFGAIEAIAEIKHEFTIETLDYSDFLVVSRELLLQALNCEETAEIYTQLSGLKDACYTFAKEKAKSTEEQLHQMMVPFPKLKFDKMLQDYFREYGEHPTINELLQTYLTTTRKYRSQLRAVATNMKRFRKCSVLMGDSSGVKDDLSSNLPASRKKLIQFDSKFRAIWDCCTLAVMIYSTVSVPIRIQHGYVSNTLSEFQLTLVIDYALDLLYVIDILLKTFYFEDRVQTDDFKIVFVTTREEIQKRYLNSTRFKFDFISTIPYSLLSWVLNIRYYSLWRLSKMLKTVYISMYLNFVKEHMESRGIRVSNTWLVLVKLILSVSIVTVIASCLWSMLKVSNGDSTLLTGVYWSLTTMTTVGFGDITPSHAGDTAYSIFVIIVGTTLGAGMVANIATILHNVIISEDNFQHRVTCIEKFMKWQKLPEDIVTRCRRVLKHEFKVTKGLNLSGGLDNLMPWPIRQNVQETIQIGIIKRSRLFFSSAEFRLSDGFLYSLALMLETEYITREELVVLPGDPLNGMYFIREGTVKLSGNHQPFIWMWEGDTFGEFALFEPEAQQMICRAQTPTILFVLPTLKFQSLEPMYPQIYAKLKTDALRIMKDANKLAERKMRGKRSSWLMTTVNRAKQGYLKGTSLVAKADLLAQKSGGISTWTYATDSIFVQVWYSLMLLIFIMNSLTIPLGIAFNVGGEDIRLLVCIYVSDLLLWINIILHARFFAYVVSDTVVRSRARILKRYLFNTGSCKWNRRVILLILKGDFLMDFIASFPFELFIHFVQPSNQLWFVFRLSKMINVLRLKKYFAAFSNRLRHDLNVSENILKVGKLIFLLFLACHWFGCIWFLIALYGDDGTNWATDSTSQSLLDADPLTQYIAALYWACFTLTTVGYGDIYPTNRLEQVFTTFVLICGTGTYTFVIGNLEEIVAQHDVTSSLFQQRITTLQEYMKMRRLAPAVQDKLTLYMNTLWDLTGGIKPGHILKMLPNRTRLEIQQHICFEFLDQRSILNSTGADFVEDFVNAMEPDFYNAGDMIFEVYACPMEFIFLVDGTAELLSSGMDVIESIHGKQTICESDFFLKTIREFGCKAKTTCNVFIMSRKRYDILLSKHSDVTEVFDSRTGSINRKSFAARQVNANLGKRKVAYMNTVVARSLQKIYFPDSSFKRIWGIIMALMTLYNVVILPFRWTFLYSERYDQSYQNQLALYFLGFDLALDMAHYVNIYLNMRHFVRYKSISLIDQPKEIQAAYFRGNFAYDVLTSLPLDLFAYIAGVRRLRDLAFLRLSRLLSIRYMPEWVQDFINYLDESGIQYSVGIWQSIKMFSLVILLSHLFGCGYFGLAYIYDFTDTWVEALGIEFKSVEVQYTVSLYWSVYTVTTVGFGNIIPTNNLERTFAILVMFTGAMLCDAGLTAVLTSHIDTLNSKSSKNVARVQCLKKFMSYRNYPDELKASIKDFFTFNSVNQANIDENALLDNFSLHIRATVVQAVCFDHMSKSSIFQGLRHQFVRSVVSQMYSRTLLENEILCHVGDKPKATYCLIRGTLELVNIQVPEGIIGPGQLVGQFHELEPFTVRAINFSEVFVLDHTVYKDCMSYRGCQKQEKTPPESIRRMREEAKVTNGSKRYVIDVLILFFIWFNTVLLPLRLPYLYTVDPLPIFYYIWDVVLHAVLLVVSLKTKEDHHRLAEEILYLFPYPMFAYLLDLNGTTLLVTYLPVFFYLKWTPKYLRSLADHFYPDKSQNLK